MALTNSERQKRWRKKNRVIYNLRRRNKRKNLSGSTESRRTIERHGSPGVLESPPSGQQQTEAMDYALNDDSGSSAPPAQILSEIERKALSADRPTSLHGGLQPNNRNKAGVGAQNSTIQALRQLIANPPKAEVKPSIYRNEFGQVISERVWKQLQERKAKARAGNYVLDEYSQT